MKALRLVFVILAVLALRAMAAIPSVDDILRLKTVSAVAHSPDGERVAFAVSSLDEPGCAVVSTVWLMSDEGREQQSPGEGQSPAWSHDGSRLAFISTRAEGRQMHVWSSVSGRVVQATHHREGVRSFAWSPLGDRIAFIAAPKAALGKDTPIIVDQNDVLRQKLWVKSSPYSLRILRGFPLMKATCPPLGELRHEYRYGPAVDRQSIVGVFEVMRGANDVIS